MNNDAHAVREIAAISDHDSPCVILHYLYVPSTKAARGVAEELKRSGFRTEWRLGADGRNWLVLARHEIVPTTEVMASIRSSMYELAAQVGGEYDGWEADMRAHIGTSPDH